MKTNFPHWKNHGSSRPDPALLPRLVQSTQQIAQALGMGELDNAAWLIKNAKAAVASMVEDVSGITLLHLACKAGDDISARLLLAAGADPNAPSGPLEKKLFGSKRTGSTPLMRAALANSAGCVEALAQATNPKTLLGKTFAATDELGRNALMIAAEQGNVAALQKIAQFDAVSGVDQGGENAAMLACRGGHLDCLRALDRAMPAPSRIWLGVSKEGPSPLSLAIESGNVECVEFLAKKALDWLASDDLDVQRMGRAMMGDAKTPSPLLLASQAGADAMFEALMEPALAAQNGAPEPAAFEQARLLRSCLAATPERAADLRRRLGAMIEIANETAQAQRHLADRPTRQLFNDLMEAVQIQGPWAKGGRAAQSEEEAVISQLKIVAHDEPERFIHALCAANDEGRGVLHAAVEHGNSRIVATLLRLLESARGPGQWPHGLEVDPFVAAVNRRDLLGRSPLARAASLGRADCAGELLNKLANPALVDRDGWTPFSRALESGNLDLARLLEFDGAKASRNFAGQSVAFLAAGWIDAPTFQWLIEEADPQELFAPSRDGQTVLHAAAASGCVQRMRLALPGSSPNAQTRDGATALAAALHVNFIEGIEMLLPLTDPALADKDGRSPLQTAITRPQSEQADRIAELLARWIDPREKPPLGPRWQKILGPRAQAVDAPTLAATWGREGLAQSLTRLCQAWDRAEAPGLGARQSVPAFGQPWNPEGSKPLPTKPLFVECSKLAQTVAHARQAMAQHGASRVARGRAP